MLQSAFTVLTVCAPLVVLVAFGIWLRRSGRLGDDAHRFITFLVYRFSLPVLIFTGVCRQNFRALLDVAVIGSTLGATLLTLLAAALASRFLGRSLRGPGIAAAYLANLSFMGFPLARNAYGDIGLINAGIVNAFTMPVFIVLGVLLLSVGRPGHGSVARRLRGTLANPIVLAAFGGLACSLVAWETPLGAWITHHGVTRATLQLLDAVLSYIGSMGLPLSLIAVGASLRFGHIHHHRTAIALCAFFKLVIAPLFTLLIGRYFFPQASPEGLGTAVLLMACPVAVALYVFSVELDAEPEFMAGLLAVTTVASCVTLPIWVAVVL